MSVPKADGVSPEVLRFQLMKANQRIAGGRMSAVTVWLLCVAILAVLVAVIPEARTCFIPPNAPTRGFYEACWQEAELWG